MARVYLDYNATTPVDERVSTAIHECLTGELAGVFGNPSSSHFAGTRAGTALSDARSAVASLIRAPAPSCVLWESCASESVNHVIKALLLGDGLQHTLRGRHIVTSAVEHVVVHEICDFAVRALGARVTRVSPGLDGIVSAASLAAAVEPDTFLVTIMHANNEVGAVNDVAAIVAACRAAGGTTAPSTPPSPPPLPLLVHSDCSQSLGKIPVDVQAMGLDFATFAGHKLYAPKGVGATYVRPGLLLPQLLHGAGQEGGLRAGTENVPYAVGFGVAAALCSAVAASEPARLALLRDSLAWALKVGAVRRGLPVTVNGPLRPWFDALPAGGAGDAALPSRSPCVDTCLPNTLSIAFPGTFSVFVLHALRGTVAASAGAACHSHHTGSTEHAHVSHVLTSMCVDRATCLSTMRLTVGRWSREEEVHVAAGLILDAVQADYDMRQKGGKGGASGAAVPHPPPLLTGLAAASPAFSTPSKAQPEEGQGKSLTPVSPLNLNRLPHGALTTSCLFHADTYRFRTAANVVAVARVVSEVKGDKDSGAGGSAGGAFVMEAVAALDVAPGSLIGPAVPPSPDVTHVIVLDRTVAHPQGGGQPSDVGLICTQSAGQKQWFRFSAVRWGLPPHERSVLHYGRFVEVDEHGADEGGAGSLPTSGLTYFGSLSQVEVFAERLTKAPSFGPPVDEGVAELVAHHVGFGTLLAQVAISTSGRELNARLHSAGHLLDLAVSVAYPSLFPSPGPPAPRLKPGKGYHFPDGPWVEYDDAVPVDVRDAFIPAVNKAIGELVARNAATAIHMLTKQDEAALTAFGINPASDLAHLAATAPVRVICVGAADNACPCGGTHVREAGQLKGLAVTKIKVAKGKTKVSYVLQPI